MRTFAFFALLAVLKFFRNRNELAAKCLLMDFQPVPGEAGDPIRALVCTLYQALP